MGAIIQLAERRETRKAAGVRGREQQAVEECFRYPQPDVVSEVSCYGPRRERSADETREWAD